MALTNEELRWATILALTTPPRGMPKPPKAYLTFYSPDGIYSIGAGQLIKHWNGILEYSLNAKDWIEWDGNYVNCNDYGYLYFRGSGNTVITGRDSTDWRRPRWLISPNTRRVFCYGNIENLLDYETVLNGQHPTMSPYCFIGLFFQWSGLLTAPELPSTQLADYCYCAMFSYCTSLVSSPKLPATTLYYRCYGNMFDSCSSLEVLPQLPAPTFAGYCYEAMFQNCTRIKISTVWTPEYSKEFRVPNVGIGEPAGTGLKDMFINTGGPFKGTPTINTTYYTDHEPV